MIRYVVDASCIGPLVLRDEAANAIAEVLRALERGECMVPAHWRFEVANMLVMAERRGRIEPNTAAENLADLDALPIEIDAEPLAQAWSETIALARLHRLTVYDSAYLELAKRLSLVLVSTDKKLLAAAALEGVETVS